MFNITIIIPTLVVLTRHYGVKFIQDGGIIYALRGRHDGVQQ